MSLYALISKCTDAQHRGLPWSAIFWKEIRPQDDGGSEPTAPTVEAAAAKQKNDKNNYDKRGGAHG